jgi:hypothetical protein
MRRDAADHRVWLDIAAHDRAGRDDTSVSQDDTRQQKDASPNPAPIADPNRRRHLLSAPPIWPANLMSGGDDRNVVTDGHVVANNDIAIEVDMQRRREKAVASDH